MRASAEHAGIFIKETKLEDPDEAIGFVEEGYPVILATSDGNFVIIESIVRKRFESTVIAEHVTPRTYQRRDIQQLLTDPQTRTFVAKKEFDCDSVSNAAHHGGHDEHHHHHMSPVQRFLGLLNLERRDIWTVVLFSFVSGVLTLATPLAVESLVNIVSWGTYIQPLIVLGLMLLTCLGIAGVLKVLQTLVVEMIQRRQFVRIVSDLSHRFPRANQSFLEEYYPRELANRVFDIMTIQKATAVLLLDGVNIVLTTFIGLVLLALYHPFLLGFDIALVLAMVSMTWLLGRGGIRTAIDESITKYQVAHWLQDVIASPATFKVGGAEQLAVQRANQLTVQYITARKRQFRVVIRQVAFAVTLQVVASTVVLALGGWLVISGELTLGQLVASELVVTVVVGAFAKAGKALEKFYDLMAGVDKVGHLIDIPTDARHELGVLPDGPIGLRWGDLVFERKTSHSKISAAAIDAGRCVAIVGDDNDGKSDLARSLAGLHRPTRGLIQVGSFDAMNTANGRGSRVVGYAGDKEIFAGTLRENIDLARAGIRSNRIHEVPNFNESANLHRSFLDRWIGVNGRGADRSACAH